MSLKEHAKKELELAGLFDKDSDYGGMLAEAVMELIEVFSKQGHSGASAPRVLGLFKVLGNYGNLSPLTGHNDEWNDVGNGVFQNKRASAVFKENSSDKAYYLDAIIWRTPSGSSWTGKADELSSRQYIKSFPFTPKTFYVDVTETEINPGDWEFHIKDREQLLQVFELYEKHEQKI